MKTITLCSFKGGTTKTSTALHLGAALSAFHNKRVLLIDFDPQANLSTGLGVGTDNLNTMVQVLQGEKIIKEVIHGTMIEGLDLIPANTYLDQIEASAPLVSDPYAHERLRKSLKNLDYDFIFIDIPPSLGWLCQSAFYASQHSLICSVPEPYSVLALHRLAKYHQAINENHTMTILGVLFSLWDERGATNKAFIEGVESVFPGKLFETRIRRDIKVNRAILQGLPVFKTDPNSRVAKDYKACAEEFLKRITQSETNNFQV
jgi:chromosome partitioning protein